MTKQVSMLLRGIIECSIVDDRGRVIRRYPKQRNLIMNSGMDKIAAAFLADCFSVAKAGTGSTQTFDDGGTTNASQSGTTVTLSGGTFLFVDTPTDTGKMIKWNTGGEESRIVSVTDTTHAEVTPSQTVASGNFKVYRTNQTSLFTDVESHSYYVISPTGACGTTISAPDVAFKRTYDFAVRGSNKTYAEVGLFHSDNTMWSRILLASPITVTIGRALRIVYTLTVGFSPTSASPFTITAPGPITGLSISGQSAMQLVSMRDVESSGSTGQTVAGMGDTISHEPSSISGQQHFLSTASTTWNAFGTNGPNRSGGSVVSPTLGSYTALNFFRDKTATYGAGVGTGTTWRSFGFGNGGISSQGLVTITDATFTKGAGNTLTLVYRLIWGRVLS